MISARVIALFSVFLVVGCGSVTVRTDFDPEVDFSGWRTYAWHQGKIISGDALSKNPLIRERVVRAVNEIMGDRGWRKIDEDDCDFLILVHAGVREKVQVNDWGGYGRYDHRWGMRGGRVTVHHYEEGSLVVDFIDAKRKSLAWRGVGTRILDGHAPTQEDVNNVVMEILKRFPPE